jgi:hypothetical protein
MMKRSFLRSLAILLGIATFTLGATASDVTSSKNELLAKGSSPHVRFVDDSGDDYQTTVNGGVFRVTNLDASTFLNVPPTGVFGIELSVPTTLVATPFTVGGSLADGSYFFVVTALDGSGETTASNEAQCTVSGGGGSGRCDLTWTAVAPPASSYRIYMGTGTTLENHYATAVVASYSATTSPLATPGTPPEATTAYFVKLASDGIHFADGSIQLTASGAGAWQFNVLNILNANTGNVGISSGGGIFTPDALLTVLGIIDLNDRGALLGAATNNVQFRSNYKSSTDRLWNTGQSSWATFLGDGADVLRFYRAPATAGPPVYSPMLSVFSTGAVNIGPQTTDPITAVGLNVQGSVFIDNSLTVANSLTGGLKDRGFLTLRTTTEAITMTPGDQTFVLCTGGGITINLPTNAAGVLSGRIYVIKNIGLAGNCTIDPSGAQTIDNSLPTLTLTPGDIARLVAHPSAGDWERW